jgi:hypothetical protein
MIRSASAIIALGVAAAALAAAPREASADAAKAKAANSRGYALHKAKNFRGAMVEYRKAVAEDPAYLLAHYNLACVASLLHDGDTAIAELAWVYDRATWDPAAKAAIAKVQKDRDLAWLLDNEEDARRYANPENIEIVDVLEPPCCFTRGAASTDAAVAKALAGATGKHAEACSAAAVSAPVDGTQTGKGVVAASLRDGVAILDASGRVLARSEPVGCRGPGDQLEILNHGAALPQPYEELTAPVREIYYVILGIRSGDARSVQIYAIKNKQLSRVFDAVVASPAGTGHVEVTPLGSVVHVAPGETKPRVFRWDGAAAKLVQSN